MTDTDAVRRLFDDVADEYDRYVPYFAEFGHRLVDWCGLGPGMRVLDLATGRGAVALPAARAVGGAGAVAAVDNAPRMVRALAADAAGLPQLTAQVRDIRDPGFPDASFDAVTCGFALHFVDSPERVLAEAHRVLRPGGLLAYSVPGPLGGDGDRWAFYGRLVRELDRERARRLRERSPRAAPGAHRPRTTFTPAKRPLPELLAEAGFTGQEQRAAEVHLPLRDPQHFWSWHQSHGARGFVADLGPDLAAEFERRLLAALTDLASEGPLTLDRGAAFHRARKSG